MSKTYDDLSLCIGCKKVKTSSPDSVCANCSNKGIQSIVDSDLREQIHKIVRENVDIALSFNWTLPQHEKQVDEATDKLVALFHSHQSNSVELRKRVGSMRQWLNEDRITNSSKLVTNNELMFWLTRDSSDLEASLTQDKEGKVDG